MHLSTHPLGKTVRKFRLRQGLNQSELATRTGYDVSFISRIENGYLQPIKEEILSRFASALCLTVNEAAEMRAAATESQRTIRIPWGACSDAYRALHGISRMLWLLSDDDYKSILHIIQKRERSISPGR